MKEKEKGHPIFCIRWDTYLRAPRIAQKVASNNRIPIRHTGLIKSQDAYLDNVSWRFEGFHDSYREYRETSP